MRVWKVKATYNQILFYSFTSCLLLVSCNEKMPIPKPPLYLKVDLPPHKYEQFSDNCPYKFEKAKIYKIKSVEENGVMTCHKDIELDVLKGTINFSYIHMTEPLASYVNYANDRVGEHKIKATGIKSELILNPDKHVFGALFSLQGDVATPFQFYLTDSINHFASGVLYFNSVPNYDSLRPSIDYVYKDIRHLIETFEWKE